jgi:hypothetical protein
MRRLTLHRMKEDAVCTLGRIETEDFHQLCVTLEEPWRDENKDGFGDTNVSRIPAGEFVAFRRMSPARGYEVFELKAVPGRKNVQLHKGNTVADTLGCILIGTAFAPNAITGSKLAFEKFMREMKDVQEFTLVVKDVPPLKIAA